MRIRFMLSLALLVIIASCSKKSTPSATKQVDVAGIFQRDCSHCHGADGMTGGAPNLAKTTLDLNGLNEIIAKGHGHMPAFEDKLSSNEITSISKWIISIKGKG